jgi:Bacterial lectin
MKLSGLSPRALSVILASFCLAFLICTPAAHAQNSFTYPLFPTGAPTGLQVNGNSSIVASGNTNFLQVTPATTSQVGSAWYTNPSGQSGSPATLALSGGFNTTFTFQFTDLGSSCCAIGADGIAFVVQNGGFSATSTSGASAVGPSNGLGGEIGFTGLTNSVAVQFDTYCNSEYGDTCAAAGPTTADQVTIESCGTSANMVLHGTSCQFGTVDLSVLPKAIFMGDGNVHTAQIIYIAPSGAGTCPSGSSPVASGCGTLTVVLDSQTVLTVPFNLGIINAYNDSTDAAYVGFTGATGGSFENQDVLSWNFGVTVSQPFSTTAATTSDFTTNTGENEQTLDLSTASSLTCQGQTGGTSCPAITLLTTNNAVSASNTWLRYVNGTPWATSICAARPSNGGPGNLCSLFVNACYGGSVSQSQSDDFYCPTATPGDGSITLSDTWDPISPKPTIAPGTTVSLIDFVPSAAGQTWTASPVGQTTPPNSACTNVSTPFQCELSDTLTVVYGDQTTTRGKVPKKGWLVSVFNVPMLTTQWSVLNGGVGNPSCPTPNTNLNNNSASSSDWFNSSCQLQYQVNEATVSGTNTNGFVAAPPASITYGLNAAVTPGSTDASNTNGTLVNPWVVDPGSINTVIGGLDSQKTLPDGTYILHWSAVDNVGISEKSIVLDQTTGDTCNNPVSGGTPSSFKAPCYNTDLFVTTINVDSTPPQIKLASFSPASSTATFTFGQTVYPIFTCTDNLSGVASCGGASVSCPLNVAPPNLTSPNALNTQTLGLNHLTATVTDCAGNTNTTTISYTVVSNADLQIKTLPLLTLGIGVPGIIPVTYGAAITNLGSTAASNVTVTTTFSTPAGILLGTPTATISTVTCSNSPCTLKGITISSTPCSISGTTVTCSVPTLNPVTAKTGLWMEIIMPIARNSKPGQFTSTSTVTSAGGNSNPNNSVSQTYNVIL